MSISLPAERAQTRTTRADTLDDLAKKLFAQCDDDFPGVRVQALDALRDHLKKSGQSLRDVLHEIETAIPAQKYSDIETKYNSLVDDHNKALLENAQWVQRDQQQEKAIAALRREVITYKSLVWMRLNRKRLITGAMVAVGVLFASLHDYDTWPPSVDAGLRSVAANAVWDQGFDKPSIIQIGSKPYWVMIKGDTDTNSFSDRQGHTISMRCLRVFAAEAEADSGQYRKPHPYALFGFGWLSWPERARLCRPAPNQEASQ
jgi:hypothetical protein